MSNIPKHNRPTYKNLEVGRVLDQVAYIPHNEGRGIIFTCSGASEIINTDT